jgi:hypothetical protein
MAEGRAVPLPERSGSTAAATVVPVQLQGSPGAAVAAGDDGSAQAFATAADEFGRFAGMVGKIADRAAAREGQEEGALAGLDPEFRPRSDGTIYSEAYNGAGLEVFKRRSLTDLEAGMEQVAEQHAADPSGLEQALVKLKAGAVDGLRPELRPYLLPDLETSFQRRRLGLVRQATRQHRDKVRAEQTASLVSTVANKVRAIEQQAYRLGLDGDASQALAGEVAELRRQMLAVGPDGNRLLSPAAAERELQRVQREVADARLLGAFDRIQTVTGKRAFIAQIEADFKDSKGLAKLYTLDEMRALTGRMEAEAARGERQAEVQVRQVAGQIGEVRKLAEKGFPARASDLSALRASVAASGDPRLEAALAETEAVLKWQGAAARSTPLEIDQYVRQERARMQEKGALPVEVARLEAAERLQDEMRRELKRDPLGWAERVQAIQVTPIDMSSPEAAQKSLAARRVEAETVAARYGQPVRFFRPAELDRMAEMANQGGDNLVQISATLAEAFGSRADEALREVAQASGTKGGQTLAVLGSLVQQRASPQIIRAAAAGIALRRTENFKALAPSAEKSRPVVQRVFGSALQALPQTAGALTDLANAAYESRARAAGVAEFDERLYREIVQDITGRVTVKGVSYGGIGSHRAGFFSGSQVVVPAGVRQDRFDTLVESITNADIKAAGAVPYDVNKRRLGADAVRRGTFVAIGANRYLVALGDPQSDAQWLLDAQGRRLEVNLGAMLPGLKKRRPKLFLDGE